MVPPMTLPRIKGQDSLSGDSTNGRRNEVPAYPNPNLIAEISSDRTEPTTGLAESDANEEPAWLQSHYRLYKSPFSAERSHSNKMFAN